MNAKNMITTICLFALAISVSAQGGRGRGKNNLQDVTTVNGTITGWTYNSKFEYDGLFLDTGGATIFIKFPPHMGQQVRALGNRISVSGVFRGNRDGVPELRMISMSRNGHTINDQKPHRQTPPPHEPVVNGKGTIIQKQFHKKGDVNGFILDNGTVLRLRRSAGRQLSSMVQVGSAIEYTGRESVLKPGRVRAYDYRIVEALTITVNGTQYLVR